jgi:L-methionine (R)-S-oxide reductase
MAEELNVPLNASREEKYLAVLPQVFALLEHEVDLVANMANIAAALKQAMGFFWVGFYRNIGGELVLGPFQGPVACTRIPFGKGVCGTSLEKKETLIVSDVDKFPGHIACSSLSKSEIVVPLIVGGKVVLILDVDSDKLNDFTVTDGHYLEKIIGLLAKHYKTKVAS